MSVLLFWLSGALFAIGYERAGDGETVRAIIDIGIAMANLVFGLFAREREIS